MTRQRTSHPHGKALRKRLEDQREEQLVTADNNEQVATQKIDDYKKYWNQVVVPDYDDFFQNLDNLRKAFHCASSLFHMADWLYWDNKAYIDANLTWLDGSVRKPVVDETNLC